ncbi:hypothetical protein AVEN_134725-1 [Araneus ventricosus]|uniref:Uncharacterized protein n=1 Tax=Araneus ventricosus TaxID=182803 RepID=A0A4Y2KQA1_ARAVE|nr:hypothetical protein AVEN_30379-1 [Araneus ventricosus]GBN04376.1 hypothetical protein AVEN_134725-1 [Araneus ventricosus]
MHKELDNCSRVFPRQDRLTKSLVPPYSEPHLVVSRALKQTVSIDRLIPAFQLAEIQPFQVSFSIEFSYRRRRGVLWRGGQDFRQRSELTRSSLM